MSVSREVLGRFHWCQLSFGVLYLLAVSNCQYSGSGSGSISESEGSQSNLIATNQLLGYNNNICCVFNC